MGDIMSCRSYRGPTPGSPQPVDGGARDTIGGRGAPGAELTHG